MVPLREIPRAGESLGTDRGGRAEGGAVGSWRVVCIGFRVSVWGEDMVPMMIT